MEPSPRKQVQQRQDGQLRQRGQQRVGHQPAEPGQLPGVRYQAPHAQDEGEVWVGREWWGGVGWGGWMRAGGVLPVRWGWRCAAVLGSVDAAALFSNSLLLSFVVHRENHFSCMPLRFGVYMCTFWTGVGHEIPRHERTPFSRGRLTCDLATGSTSVIVASASRTSSFLPCLPACLPRVPANTQDWQNEHAAHQARQRAGGSQRPCL